MVKACVLPALVCGMAPRPMMMSLHTTMTHMRLYAAHGQLVLALEPSSGRMKIERRMTGVGQAVQAAHDAVKAQVPPQGHICLQIRAERRPHSWWNEIREGGVQLPQGRRPRWRGSTMGKMEVLGGARHFRSAPGGSIRTLNNNLREHRLVSGHFLSSKPQQHQHHQTDHVPAHSHDVIPQ